MCGRDPSLTAAAYSRSEPSLTFPRREKNTGGPARMELRRRPVRTGAKILARFTTCRDASLSSVRDALRIVRFSSALSSRIRATVNHLQVPQGHVGHGEIPPRAVRFIPLAHTTSEERRVGSAAESTSDPD